MIEGDWFFPLSDELFVQNIQHLKERHVGTDTTQSINPETASVVRP
jgi:hypothetical protein